jgi:hypothetical protein
MSASECGVNDVRQIEMHTAEPIVTFKVIDKLKDKNCLVLIK